MCKVVNVYVLSTKILNKLIIYKEFVYILYEN